MRGGFAQIAENEMIRFFEVYCIAYHESSVHRMKAIDCLEQSEIGKYLSLIGMPIPEGTKYLYKVFTYHGRIGIEDPWDFAQSISDYQQFGFCKIEDLLDYCKNQWGLEESNFRPLSETDIPH